MLKSDLCDYMNLYIVLKWTINVAGDVDAHKN